MNDRELDLIYDALNDAVSYRGYYSYMKGNPSISHSKVFDLIGKYVRTPLIDKALESLDSLCGEDLYNLDFDEFFYNNIEKVNND